MTAGDRAIRWATAAVVVALGGVAAYVSYSHILDVAVTHGETGVSGALVPVCVDGMLFVASMVMLDAARRGQRSPGLAKVALGLGIGATVSANVLHGIGHGPVGAVLAAWPAVTLVTVVELLMGMIRRGRTAEKTISSETAELPFVVKATGREHALGDPGPVAAAPEIREQLTDLPVGRPATRVADSAAPETGNGLAGSVVATPALAGLGLRNSTAEKRPAGGEIPHPDSAPETAKTLGDPVIATPAPQCSEPAFETAPTAFETAPVGAELNTGTEHPDPVVATARDHFGPLLSTGAVPSLRQIRRELRCGHPRARLIRDALAAEST